MKYLLVAVLLALGACSTPKVSNLGDGLHSVSACAEDPLVNPQVTATRVADKYCEKTGQEAVVETFDTQECPRSEFSTTRVIFACR